MIAGALQGDFNEDPNFWSQVGQIATGFIPIAGQIADGRDFLKALNDLEQSEYKSLGAWAALGLVTVGFVPGVGDAISKVGRKGFEVLSNSGIVKRIGKLLDADVVRDLVSQAGDLARPVVNQIKDAIITKLKEIQDAARQLGDEVAQGVDNVIEEVTGQRTFDRMAIEGSPGGGQFDNTNQPQPKQPSPSPNPSVPTGRVAEPGGQPDKFKTFKENSEVPDRYKNDSRFNDLATDPDKGNKVIPASRVEAMAGLEAESQGLVPGPIKRGPSETEFYDAQGRPWDVKAPPSPKPGAPWKFDPEKSGDSIKRELSKKATPKGAPPGTFPNEVSGQPEARRVILDSTYMTEADHTALWGWLNDNLTADELDRIVEVNTQLQ